jgi:hypothetical protein
MRAVLWAIAAAVVLASGCAQKDWIDRTLVTVDVTGSWHGIPVGPTVGHPGEFWLDLKQEGTTVRGFLQAKGAASPPGPVGGPISGTVTGDVFRFQSTRRIVVGELTVNGDEMSGTVSIGGTRPITLRRVDPSSSR